MRNIGMSNVKQKKASNDGTIMVMVVILAALAGIMATGIVMASSSSLRRTARSFNFERSFYAAEAGIERAIATLSRTNSLNDVLVFGLSGLGNTVTYGDAEFRISVTDNNDGDGDDFSDCDNIVIVSATGTCANTERAIQVEVFYQPLDIDPQDANAAFAIYGTNTEVVLQGNPNVDGYDYDVPANFYCTGAGCNGSVIPTNPGVAGIFSCTTSTVVDLQGSPTLDGNPAYEEDLTGGSPTATEWENFAMEVAAKADYYISGNVAGNTVLGTRDEPTITVCTNDIQISGTVDGAGILIIYPGVTFAKSTGNWHYEGLIILMSDGTDDATIEFNHQGAAQFFGALISLGDYVDYKPHGNPDIKYSSQALANLANLDALNPEVRMETWREVKRVY